MRASYLLIPVLSALMLTGGCLTAEKIITADARVTAPSLADFKREVFIREASIFPTPADAESWKKEAAFDNSRFDDGSDISGYIVFLSARINVPSSPRARAILDADRNLLRAGLSPSDDINLLRLRALETLRNERLAASSIARGLPEADTERIAFAMLFSPDERSRSAAFTLFRTYLIRSPEPIEPFIEGLKAVLESEAPLLNRYHTEPLTFTFSDLIPDCTLDRARELLDADAARKPEPDYLDRSRKESEAARLDGSYREPYPLDLIAAFHAFYRAQCQSPDFRLTDVDLERVVYQMLNDPAMFVRKAAFAVFQQEILRGYDAAQVVSLVEKTARDRILFNPGLARYRGEDSPIGFKNVR